MTAFPSLSTNVNHILQSASNILKKYLDIHYAKARIGRVCFQLVDKTGAVQQTLYSNSFQFTNKYVQQYVVWSKGAT